MLALITNTHTHTHTHTHTLTLTHTHKHAHTFLHTAYDYAWFRSRPSCKKWRVSSASSSPSEMQPTAWCRASTSSCKSALRWVVGRLGYNKCGEWVRP